jgi:hypothetical protein
MHLEPYAGLPCPVCDSTPPGKFCGFCGRGNWDCTPAHLSVILAECLLDASPAAIAGWTAEQRAEVVYWLESGNHPPPRCDEPPPAWLPVIDESPYPCANCGQSHDWDEACAPAGLADTLDAERARDRAEDLADARDDRERLRILWAAGEGE